MLSYCKMSDRPYTDTITSLYLMLYSNLAKQHKKIHQFLSRSKDDIDSVDALTRWTWMEFYVL